MSADSLADLLQNGFRYALSLTHDRARAEDLLHDAWLAVLRAGGPQHKGYLFSAIRTRFLNHHKRERLVPCVSLDEARDAGLEESQNLFELDLDSGDLERSLASLRPVEREALFLSAVEGYTAEEIAIRTNQPRGTVLSLIFRAKQKLRRYFAQEDLEVKK